MQYVAAHTSVPIPKLYKIHTEESGRIYIEMEFVRGQTLSAVLDELSKDQTARIFAQLRQHVSALRALPPPAPGIVSSAFGNPAYDGRIGARFFGPMCVNEFQALARCDLVLEDVHFLGQEVLQVHTAHYETKFTHADLGARNIIVRGDNIAAIVDWAYSGWYPEYWEFTKAHFVIREAAWEENIRTAVPCYEKELAAEEVLWERIPEPGTAMAWHRDGLAKRTVCKVKCHLRTACFTDVKGASSPYPFGEDDSYMDVGACDGHSGLDVELALDRGRPALKRRHGRLRPREASANSPPPILSDSRPEIETMAVVLSQATAPMPQLVTLAAYNRGNLPQARNGHPDQRYGWRILILPQDARERHSASAFEATTACDVDSATSRLINAAGDWWLRASRHLDPTGDSTLLGQIAVGEVPMAASSDEIGELFSKVALPAEPQQNSLTWALDAVAAMQTRGWARKFDRNRLRDEAVAYADDRMHGAHAKEPRLKVLQQ
ncbi:hypothetical protein PWT90_02089 [Aphanocladium album]|nr:hypothetical protein PWT90_02089 [Aphanocladium album]